MGKKKQRKGSIRICLPEAPPPLPAPDARNATIPRWSQPSPHPPTPVPLKRAASSTVMPSLGFLKKKRTKDSQGSASDFATSPISPVLSKTSNILTEPDHPPSTSDSGNAAPSTAPSGTSAPAPAAQTAMNQTQGVSASANTQNVPSIKNLVHQPNYQGSQHDSAYSSGVDGNSVPQLHLPTQQPHSNPVRETKGKYTLQDFEINRTLGTGSFGRVHLVQSKHNQRFYAVKVLKKAQVVKMKQVEHTNDERRMLQRCKHPFLIALWGTWQDSKNLYMVMEFIEGGELFSLLRKSQVSFSCSVCERREAGQSVTLTHAALHPAISQPGGQILRGRSDAGDRLSAQHEHYLPRPQTRKPAP